MNLVVGNKVTYEDKLDNNKVKIIIAINDDYIKYLEDKTKCKIKKVEACNWEEIEFVEE